MSIQSCSIRNRSGFKSSRARARSKAVKQRQAIITYGNDRAGILELDMRRIDTIPPDIAQAIKATGKRWPKKKQPQMVPPKHLEREYQSELAGVTAVWKALAEKVFTKPLVMWDRQINGERSDTLSDDVGRVLASLEIGFQQTIPAVGMTAMDIGQKTNKWNDTQWRKVMKAVVGIELFRGEPWLQDVLKDFTAQNVNLVTKLSHDVAGNVQDTIVRGFRQGRRHEQISKELFDIDKGVFKTAETRAKLIARDQVSKFNGQLTMSRQKEVGITRYTWVTAGDERVRASHRIMNDRVCRWDDASVYWDGESWVGRDGVEEHPGQDIQCRCYAEPVFDALFDETTTATTPPPNKALSTKR